MASFRDVRLVATGALIMALFTFLLDSMQTFQSLSSLYIEQDSAPDRVNTETAAGASPLEKKSRRKFVEYVSSEWEILWLANIDRWASNQSICEQVYSPEQEEYMREFSNEYCTFHATSRWCLVNDTVPDNIHWFNKETLVRVGHRPQDVPEPTPKDLRSQKAFRKRSFPENVAGQPKVFSKFVFLDEVTGEKTVEYIEPLVSHLRHPTAKCLRSEVIFMLTTRSYIMPPASLPPNTQKVRYFDAGASSWYQGLGGPSLSYFTNVWRRYGINFDTINAYEAGTSPDAFYETVPRKYRNRTKFQKCYISSNHTKHSKKTPFIPKVIKEKASIDDYVLFKLDIDSGDVEQGTVDYLLDPANDEIDYIDEFLWEHHAGGNYLMMGDWGRTASPGVSVYDSYLLFLALRKRGVRAHSWV